MGLYRSTEGGTDKYEALYSLAKQKVLGNSYTVPSVYANRCTILQGGYYVDYKECWVYMKIRINTPQTVTPPNISTCLQFYDMPVGWTNISGNSKLIPHELLTSPYNDGANIIACGVDPGTTHYGLTWVVRPLASYPTQTPWHKILVEGEEYEIYGKYYVS